MNAPDAGRYDKLHGDEDWKEPASAAEVAECVTEIIEDEDLLIEHILMDYEQLAKPMADLMRAVNGACIGNPEYTAKLIRAASDMQKQLQADALDAAKEMADERIQA